ncbi:TPA: hypothetical protein DEP94_01620 [Candidatus Nomurabacteria bacterium]|nr:hypothetical protein [Candidatus Nomurabacteria bacterium]
MIENNMYEIYILIFIFSAILKSVYNEILYHSRKERLIINIVVFFTMMSWEFLSHTLNVWLFPGPGLLGINIFGLPIELYIGYIVLPDFVFTAYELIRNKLGKSYKK